MDFLQDKRPDQHIVDNQRMALRDKPSGPVPTAAFSTLKNFEECRYRVYLSKVEKIKGPPSEAADRGQSMHDVAEAYIKGEGEELPPPRFLDKLAHQYYTLRKKYEAHPERFQLEQNWSFTKYWEDTEWKANNVWLRQKLDVFELESETSAIIYDHKSGKKWGNELKHGDQGLQYAIGAFIKYPKLQLVCTNFYYTDQGEILPKKFTRSMVTPLIPRLEQRIFAMTTATEEELQVPNPSKHNCRYCDHMKNGVCEYAIQG